VRPAEGPANQSRIDDVSANVVSVLQGGAFFGALSSAPISGGSCIYLQLFGLHHRLLSRCKGLPRIVPSMGASKFPTNNDCFSYSLRLLTDKDMAYFPSWVTRQCLFDPEISNRANSIPLQLGLDDARHSLYIR
jgi:hypothetical protein